MKLPDENQPKRIMTWEEFDGLCQDLANMIKGESYKYLYGIERGGLVVAVRLSHLTGVPMTTNPVIRDQNYNEVLIVDDICDSGYTLKHFVTYGYDTAALVTRHNSIVKPLHTADIIVNNDWVVFP